MSEKKYQSGFLTIIGRPNVGKSTLLNQILGQKVAITSPMAQTTRNSIRGVYSGDGVQMVFIDTPGIHKPKDKLGAKMVNSAKSSLGDVDGVIYMIDATMTFGRGEEYIINELVKVKAPVFLLINKIDLLEPEALLPIIQAYSQRFTFAEIIPIAAFTGENVENMLKVITAYMPEGVQYYPEDMKTDQPEEYLIAELIREQVIACTKEEVPHSVAITISAMEERDNGMLYVEANIFVDRDSQKAIIIGKNGSLIKKIGTGARREMERLLGDNIFLQLKVKTQKDWRNNDGFLRRFDLEND